MNFASVLIPNLNELFNNELMFNTDRLVLGKRLINDSRSTILSVLASFIFKDEHQQFNHAPYKSRYMNGSRSIAIILHICAHGKMGISTPFINTYTSCLLYCFRQPK